jgi:hypothetical protein
MPLTFFKDFGSAQTFKRKASDIENDTRTIVNYLVDQVEFANVIISEPWFTQKRIGNPSFNPKIESCGNNNHFGFRKSTNKRNSKHWIIQLRRSESSAGWMQELERLKPKNIISSFVFRDGHFIRNVLALPHRRFSAECFKK